MGTGSVNATTVECWNRAISGGGLELRKPRGAEAEVTAKRNRKAEPAAGQKKFTEHRILPMELRLGDRLVDETGEYEVIGRPYTTNAGKDVHVRVKRVDNAEVTMIRSWSARERVSVKRG
jgi:hypothetical protein